MRIERIGDATLYLGDCLGALPILGPVNAVVTDPPFNAGKAIKNDSMSLEEWTIFCQRVANRIADWDPENILIEVGKGDTGMQRAFEKNFSFRWTLVLNYTNSMRNGAVGYSNFGLVLWYGGKCYRRYKDRLDASLTSTIDEFRHPCPKMTTHYERLVEMFSAPGQTILDPFMGSGTTGVACANLGRKFIGIEIEPRYFDIACRRIRDAYAQPRLPLEEPAQIKPGELF